ncbi:MAG TPA: sugar ABC transporter permease [Rectinema sp.]|jgi:putative multiple sugar transport system permease protein|nr:sugar ABC transporter permease [Spirochaetia bacterium]MDI9427104.1 sugar ABC transporter permease [Spirochaetota bacterium]NLH90656.1 sugar ABC transporter permease [Treponema sp.]OQC75113.1 MAG: Xylose transport system permease protein XylH [Spirochaetes bacterium ADurb.Bin001]HNP92492.1 sugar ABC transporter permease [Rectinema sp.]
MSEFMTVVKKNVREYGMYIALAAIMAVFTILSKGIFISSRNIANLLNQTGYIAVLAVGMTLVIVIRHIDLSVGFLSGFLGAIAAIALTQWNWSLLPTILFVLALGVVAGLFTALPVASLGIPAFVASLAGWLIYRGALMLVTAGTGTIIIPNEAFNAIGNGYIPDILASETFLPGVHKTTLLLGAIAIVFAIFSQIADRKRKIQYKFEVSSSGLFAAQLIFVSVILGFITWILAGYNGLSWTIVIMLAVVLVYDFITRRTVLGRHIYAVGGNPEAAELSGIRVKKITFVVFASMGFLAALSGILFTARLKSATPQAGTLFEMDAIASAYIGGVSAAGGVGSISGSLIGALVYMSLMNGMNLLGTDISLQYIIRGLVLLLAVIFDVMTRKQKA